MVKPLLTFAVSALAGIAGVLGYAAMNRPVVPSDIHELAGNVWVTEQVTLQNLPAIRSKGFKSVVDLRPDGEAADQPTSTSIGETAKSYGLQFAYIPVRHGDIPENAVDALAQALAKAPKPILLYCRSGRRAARTWALVEASKPDGLDAAKIRAAVQSAGQTADDLNEAISSRISARVK
ncbi:MAG: TIGR01244 family phosphatase [Gammaproteobacteria bacterium]|nr:MAG: TIGR01244 family phosphatase [Gammaproteobacteria bacterium]